MSIIHGSSSLLHFVALICIFSFLVHRVSAADSHFEGFEAEENDDEPESLLLDNLPPRPIQPDSPITTTELSPLDPRSSNQDADPKQILDHPPESTPAVDLIKASSTSFEYWDEDEFEGLPVEQQVESPELSKTAAPVDQDLNVKATEKPEDVNVFRLYIVEIVCVSFLVMFILNYFIGKRENENLALAWAAKFATKDSVFDKNFSLMGVGDGEDSPLLLKEGQNVFKFYASGRRYCQGLLATMELKSRHDLISRIFNLIVPCRDEISIEVIMNEEAMDHVIFALAKKKGAKAMQKEVRDLQRFAGFVSAPSGRKWVPEELAVISESKEVAGDLITEAMLDQVFGDKAFEKFGKGFISMHFSDQHVDARKKMLLFKFSLPDANHMADMTRLIALVPYYIDLIGRYKLSPQARSKTEAARAKVALEEHKELHSARQEALQRKKAERKKMMEEAEAKLSAEAIRKKEAKERARQMKKAMPKVKMSRH